MAKINAERLQKYLASCGVCSRRAAEKLIEQGRVKVNGRPAFLGQKVDSVNDVIHVDGHKINAPKIKNVYYMLYKPRGYVTTMSDEMDRKCIADLTYTIKERVFPVGRLDKDSEGLLLLTNDGDFANRITHPKFQIYKTYRVVVSGNVTVDKLDKIREGIKLDDGDVVSCECYIHSQTEDKTILIFIISEGKNREIRRICQQMDLEVRRLKREKIGGLSIGTLKAGNIRALNEKDIDKIFAQNNK